MKKFLLPLLAALGCFSSCSEDFDVAAPYRQITVVYGLLDVGSSTQYIRIQKAFMDENQSALVMAKEVDSSFYKDLQVEMREINGSTVTTFPLLQLVDLQAEGFPKEPGAFFQAPSYAYKTSERILPGRRYRLVITNRATKSVDSAETEVIDNSVDSLRIVGIEPTIAGPLNFATGLPTFRMVLNPFPSAAKMVEAVMRFHVINRNTSSGAETRDSFDFSFGRNDTTRSGFASNTVEVLAAKSSFFTFLGGALGPAPAGVERILDSADIVIHVGTRDMLRYQIFNGAAGGLTGDQVRPIYTNIQSENGNALGLFAARTTRIVRNVPLARSLVDSLRSNPQTANLNITGVR